LELTQRGNTPELLPVNGNYCITDTFIAEFLTRDFSSIPTASLLIISDRDFKKDNVEDVDIFMSSLKKRKYVMTVDRTEEEKEEDLISADDVTFSREEIEMMKLGCKI